ncbi:MAG: ribose-phosphate pyrophosphokinase [Acidobacteria bacterium]|nr:MAG: ribose-phosphate pyrophosphokinase [Acidobacteriota bacterium]
MNRGDLVLFALSESKDFGAAVGEHLGIALAAHEEREFEDGEHKIRPLISVRGKDVFVIQSLFGDSQQSVNDKLCRFLFFLGALKDASAERITAVMPYLCYARKDKKTKPRDPLTTRYVASLFEAVGASRALTLDVHNLAALQNAWRIPTDHLEAKNLFVDYFAGLEIPSEVVVVSPDAGGIKRAEEFRKALSRVLPVPVRSAFLEKYRSDDVLTGETFAGDVRGKTAIIIDDLISSGSTIVRAADACRQRGATAVYAAASHGLFTGKPSEVFPHPALNKIVVTNTIPPFRLPPNLVPEKVVVVDVTRLFGEAIKRIHSDESIEDLLE